MKKRVVCLLSNVEKAECFEKDITLSSVKRTLMKAYEGEDYEVLVNDKCYLDAKKYTLYFLEAPTELIITKIVIY